MSLDAALDRLIDGIEAEAEAEAARVTAGAREEAAHLLDEAARQAEAEARQWEEAQVEQARRTAAQRVAQARLDARNRLLNARQEGVGAVFAGALAALRALDDDVYRAWMHRCIVETCTASDEEVVVSEGDRARLTPAWQDAVAAALRARGVARLQLRFADEDLGGGFVVRHPRYEIDARFAALLEALGPGKRAEVAETLFD